MDFGGLLLLGVLWVVFNLLTKGRQQQGGRPSKLPTRLPPAAPPSKGDPTQREGSRLEALLREFERALEQGAGSGPLGRPSTSPLPTAEEVEERESLEAESEAAPEVVSLEAEVARPERPQVSQDEGAERLVARRIAAADARSGAHTRVDHTAFDQRIRQESADATAVRSVTPEQLRRAVVWREVLGPPVALRDESRDPGYRDFS